jgi:DmsE family decaheme c-type cytochrome
MKILRQILASCSLALGLGLAANALAADNLPDIGVNPAKARAEQAQNALKKDAVCTKCHDESEAKPVLSIYQTRHGQRGDVRAPMCISCHGASDNHVKGSPDPEAKNRPAPDVVFKKGVFPATAAQKQGGVCLTCHQSGLRQHWEGSQHEGRDIACSTCHKVHVSKDPVLNKATQQEICFTCHKEQRAQTHRFSSHPLDAGKMGCSDCHNPHGTNGPKLLIKKSVNETCYTCHPDRRGPFLWEHQPVQDDCTNCHTPHGSVNSPLLKTRLPQLCQQCHTGDHARTAYSGANLPGGNISTINGLKPYQGQSGSNQVYSRDCLNCHSNIHGSNSPAGAKFQR